MNYNITFPLSGDNLSATLVPRVNKNVNKTVNQSSQGQGYTKVIDLVNYQVAVTGPVKKGGVVVVIGIVSDSSIESTKVLPLGNKPPISKTGLKMQRLNKKMEKVSVDRVAKVNIKVKRRISCKKDRH